MLRTIYTLSVAAFAGGFVATACGDDGSSGNQSTAGPPVTTSPLTPTAVVTTSASAAPSATMKPWSILAASKPPVEICGEGADWKTLVFYRRQSCTGACQEVGLQCYRGFENVDGGACAAQLAGEPGCVSTHESDYCVCTSTGGEVPGVMHDRQPLPPAPPPPPLPAAPVGTMPAPVGTMPAPVGTMPAPVGTMPAPVGTMPAPVGTMPAPVGTAPPLDNGLHGTFPEVVAPEEGRVDNPALAGTISLADAVPGWASQGTGTTGGGTDLATATTVTDAAELRAALTAATATGGLILLEPGLYEVGTDLKIPSNTSVIGKAPGVRLNGNIEVKGNATDMTFVTNVIVRNLQIVGGYCQTNESCRGKVDTLPAEDGVEISRATNVWFDHVDIVDGQDGNLDVVRSSDFISATWCQFRYTRDDKPHAFSNLIAGSDNNIENRGKLHVTYANNWWGFGVQERMPRGRFGKVHVYNNFYSTQGNAHGSGYLWGPGVEIEMVMENNYAELPLGFTAINEKWLGDPLMANLGVYNASGNEGAEGMNAMNGTVTHVIPYVYTPTAAAEVKALVTAANCGAGNTCSLAETAAAPAL